MKHTSGRAFFLGEILITWLREKKSNISKFIDEVEYVSGVINCSTIVWIKKLLEGMQEGVTDPITIYYDKISQCTYPRIM